MTTSKSPIGRRDRRDHRRAAAGFTRAALFVAVVLLNLTALMVAFLGAAPTAHAASPSLHIKVPNATNGVASGPVGANVSVSGVGNPNSTYKIGYASTLTPLPPLPPSPPSPTVDACSQGFKDLQPARTVKTQQDGSFSDTFVWPSSTSASGSNYYVCAQDQAVVTPLTGASIQSSEVFKVLASDPPNISIDVAPSSNGTPVPTPADGGYFAGSRIDITGTNYLPGGMTLRAYVTASQTFAASDTQTYRPLPLDNGNVTFHSDGNGSFVYVVTLPQTPTGSVYLHVVSTDYNSISNFPPALDANQLINLEKGLPTPTPSPTPNTTVTTSPTTTGHIGGGQPPTPTPDPANVLAVIGLSGLSVILFVVGILLMTSASGMVEHRR